MSATDLDVLRRIYDAWSDGKFWTFELFHHDVKTRWATEVPDIDGAHGVEGLGDLFREWTSAWESCRIEADEFHEAGDKVVVFVRVLARGSGSAIDVEMKNAHVWTMQDGRAAGIRAYTDRERALREAGLADLS
jgi:ketosteroid isomerase-like protein